jgi:hypothetical protein
MNALAIAVATGIGLLLASMFIDRVLLPRRARKVVEKLLKSKAKHDPRALEKPEYGSVLGDTDCLRMTSSKGASSELQWSEIEEVHAFKRDLFSTDLICLAFRRSGKEEYYEIHEEMAGCHNLMQVLPSRLPEFSLKWFSAVADPAFKTNHQVVWRRAPSQLFQATAATPRG